MSVIISQLGTDEIQFVVPTCTVILGINVVNTLALPLNLTYLKTLESTKQNPYSIFSGLHLHKDVYS